MRTRLTDFLSVAIILSMIVLSSCRSSTETTNANDDVQNIRVQMVESDRTTADIEPFPLPNCGGNEKLTRTLGSLTSISQSATVSEKATVIGGGEIQLPNTIKLKLEIQVELAYQRSFESANSRVDSIEMAASAGTHIVYDILWEEQIFDSIVQYSLDDKVYEVPYTYKLRVPEIATSYEVECSDDGNVGHLPVQTPSSIPTPEPQPTSISHQLSIAIIGLECFTHSSGYCGLNMHVRWQNIVQDSGLIYIIGHAPFYNPPLWWVAGNAIIPSESNGQYLSTNGAYGNPGDSLEVFVCLTTATYSPGDEFFSRPQCLLSSASLPFSPR